ncbi:MAG: 4-hydroxybenzoate 3-monooxygenase [Streptosporangiales bacterium]|nr:4-hydroxybenzoate 3-monooxygenase [Streptosporangiales bacterium]
MPSRTGVVIVGAGPAGLVLGNLLHDAGVDCVVLETESRDFIEQRPRAGFIEEWAVSALAERGLADRLLERAETQVECEFRLAGERHVFAYQKLVGHRHFVYPQPLLVTDLVAEYADRRGGAIHFEVRDVTPEAIDTAEPAVAFTAPDGTRHRITADFIAGCDGARGVCADAVPDHARTISRHDFGVGWLALLAEAPPAVGRVVFGIHPRGFAAQMARSPEITRYYLEVPPGDDPENWTHERVWHELHTRLAADGAPPHVEGRLVEKRVLDMHNYVVEPMAYGRMYLTGDAAHLVAPVAAKGLNLAVHDALLLAEALRAHYLNRDDTGLDGYSERALRRVWQYQEFNAWLSEVLHGPSSGDPFRAGTAMARLRRFTASVTAGSATAELYIGKDADH